MIIFQISFFFFFSLFATVFLLKSLCASHVIPSHNFFKKKPVDTQIGTKYQNIGSSDRAFKRINGTGK